MEYIEAKLISSVHSIPTQLYLTIDILSIAIVMW